VSQSACLVWHFCLLLCVVGGSSAMRKYWSSFIQDTCILIYVVDSSNEKRLPESFSELHRVLGDERLSRVPIVIVANKQVRLAVPLFSYVKVKLVPYSVRRFGPDPSF